MTNNEILKADILDILFQNRNKLYGAYALRKTYDRRMLISLSAGLALSFLLMLPGIMKKDTKEITVVNRPEGLVVKEFVIIPPKKEAPVQPQKPVRPKPAPTVKTVQKKFTSQFDIKKDELVKQPVASVDDLSGKKIGDEEVKGKADNGTVSLPATPETGTGTDKTPVPATSDFTAKETAPEFPGGPDALNRFLSKNLNTPEQLEAGEKKMVKVRFKVDVDGFVTGFEIVESGGREFDNEVLRVCKKMPRWKPAFQNGIHVPVTYMIPVTFIGSE